MKKRHRIRNSILCFLTILFCVGTTFAIFFGIKGYRMYRDAVSEVSIEEKVETVRKKEHFTRYSDLSDFYIDAVISVEDHRFEKHHGIDLIAIGRAMWTDIKAMSWVEGGSTITQQVAKNLLFTEEKRLSAKLQSVSLHLRSNPNIVKMRYLSYM